MNRSEFLAATAESLDRPLKAVPTQLGVIHVRAPSFEQTNKARLKDQAAVAAGKESALTARILVHCICDENGIPLLDPDDEEDVKRITDRGNAFITALIKATSESTLEDIDQEGN